MAMGSRRTTPTAPVAAAVVSEAMMEPTKHAVRPVRDWYTSGSGPGAAAAEDDGGDGHALGVVELRGCRGSSWPER